MKGAISKKGYLKNSPDRKNDFNLVPSNNITMKGVNQSLKLIPIKLPEGTMGKAVAGKPGKNYTFPGYDAVLEIPQGMMNHGGPVSPYSHVSQFPMHQHFDASPKGEMEFYRRGGEAVCIPCIFENMRKAQQGGQASGYTFDQYYKDLNGWQNPSAQSVPKNIANYESTWIVPTIKNYQTSLNTALAQKYKLQAGQAPAQDQFLTAQEAQGALGGNQQYGDYLNYVQGYQAYRNKTAGTYQAPSQTSGTMDPNGEAYGYRHFGLFNLTPQQQQANQQQTQQNAPAVSTMQTGGTTRTPVPRPPAPTYQPKDAHPIYDVNGAPIMSKGRAPLPGYLQGPGTTAAQRSAWWLANGYGPDGTGAVALPSNGTVRATFKDGGNFMEEASENMKKKGTEGAFTKYCNGNVTEECIKRGLNSPNATIRKRAAFAKAMHTIAKKKTGGESGNYVPLDYLQRKNSDFINQIAENFGMHSSGEELKTLEEMHSKFMQMGGANLPLGNVYPTTTMEDMGTPIDLPQNSTWDMNTPDLQAPPSDYQQVQMDPNQLQGRPVTSTYEAMQQKNWFLSTTPDQRANAILAGTAGIAGMLEKAKRRKQEELLRRQQGSDNVFTAVPAASMSRGDYDTNSGAFRPDQMVPVQFSGGAPTGYGRPSYQMGGGFQSGNSYYMSEDEIEQFLAAGGEIQYED